MILCALCLSPSPQAYGVCAKKERILFLYLRPPAAAAEWAVNFYRRIHFQYTHFSPMSNQYAKFYIPAIWFQPIQDSIMLMFIMRRYDSNPVEIPEALLATQNELSWVSSNLSSLLNQLQAPILDKS